MPDTFELVSHFTPAGDQPAAIDALTRGLEAGPAYQPEAYIPSTDTFIEKDAAINEQIEQMRLSATKALLERPDVIIVATVSAIYGLGDVPAYHSLVLQPRQG